MQQASLKPVKNILHIIDTTGPGGAETVFIELLTHLPAEKYHPVVVIRGKGWVYEELCRRGFSPILLDAKGSFNWRYLKNLLALIRRENIDLIQSHLLGSNVYCAIAGLLSRKPVVATFHGQVDIGLYERLKGLKFAALNFGANAIVAVSDNLRQDIISRTPLRVSKTRVVYNGIDTAAFQRPRSDVLRQQFGWHDDDIIIGSLGNIRTAKAYDVLLHAAARLKHSEAKYRFVIAGQGKAGLYDDLLALRKQLALEDTVHFLGFNDDPAGFLANLDLFLLSSTTEGFSIATIQAMVSGLPVIVTRSGGPQEIVTHNVNGWMIAPGEAQAIAEAVEKVSQDAALKQRLAEQGRQHALATFDISAMLNGYESIYQQLL